MQDLGFVALDSYATGVVGPAAKIRASYGEGTVIPLFSNHGFLPFLRNLICSIAAASTTGSSSQWTTRRARR